MLAQGEEALTEGGPKSLPGGVVVDTLSRGESSGPESQQIYRYRREEKKRQKEQVLAAYKQGRTPEENPPRARLNPKLTQRGAPPDSADVPTDNDKHKPKTATKLTHDGRSLPVVYFPLYLLYCLLIKCIH